MKAAKTLTKPLEREPPEMSPPLFLSVVDNNKQPLPELEQCQSSGELISVALFAAAQFGGVLATNWAAHHRPIREVEPADQWT